MIDGLYTAIVGHIIEIFFVIVSIGVLYGVKWLKSRLSKEQQELANDVIRSVVLFVQQQFPKNKPTEKLDLAVSHAIDILNENGIKIDENTIHVLVESNLKQLKREFRDEWKNIP